MNKKIRQARWKGPTVKITVPSQYADILLLMAIALDREAVLESEILALLEAKTKET